MIVWKNRVNVGDTGYFYLDTDKKYPAIIAEVRKNSIGEKFSGLNKVKIKYLADGGCEWIYASEFEKEEFTLETFLEYFKGTNSKQ